MTDDDGRSDPIEILLHAWARVEIGQAPSVALSPAIRTLPPRSPRRPTRRVWAVAIAAVLIAAIATTSAVLSGSDPSRSRHHQALLGTPSQKPADATGTATGTAPATHRGTAPHPPPVVPSPPPPPFGYCGGLRSVADARYIVEGGAAVALVSAVITGPGTPIPQIKVIREMPLSHVRVLAGHLPDGRLAKIDSSPLSTGRYLIVVGDTGRGGYFPALGFYGVYAITGTHAYRTCYDFSGKPAHRVTAGITTIHGLIRIFAKALRPPTA